MPYGWRVLYGEPRTGEGTVFRVQGRESTRPWAMNTLKYKKKEEDEKGRENKREGNWYKRGGVRALGKC